MKILQQTIKIFTQTSGSGIGSKFPPFNKKFSFMDVVKKFKKGIFLALCTVTPGLPIYQQQTFVCSKYLYIN